MKPRKRRHKTRIIRPPDRGLDAAHSGCGGVQVPAEFGAEGVSAATQAIDPQWGLFACGRST